MTRIRLADFRHPTTKVCPKARDWFARVGLDWRDFVHNGIEVEALRSTGDHLDLIDKLEAAAVEREARDGR